LVVLWEPVELKELDELDDPLGRTVLKPLKVALAVCSESEQNVVAVGATMLPVQFIARWTSPLDPVIVMNSQGDAASHRLVADPCSILVPALELLDVEPGVGLEEVDSVAAVVEDALSEVTGELASGALPPLDVGLGFGSPTIWPVPGTSREELFNVSDDLAGASSSLTPGTGFAIGLKGILRRRWLGPVVIGDLP
jgi:hypothetical protein